MIFINGMNGLGQTIEEIEKKTFHLPMIGRFDRFPEEKSFGEFWGVTSLAADRDGNVFIADSGLNRIFVFAKDGSFVRAFGKEGQGPGEFLGNPDGWSLRLTCGRDGYLYINDPRNARISKVTISGKLLSTIKTRPYFYETPTVDDKGRMYRLSDAKSGYLLDVFDHEQVHISSKIESSHHSQSSYFNWPGKKNIIDPNVLLKTTIGTDRIAVFSNNSMKLFILNEAGEYQVYPLNNRLILESSTQELKDALSRKRPKNSHLGTICPIRSLFADGDERLYLTYYNRAQKRMEIYRYDSAGGFIDRLIPSPEISLFALACAGISGRIYALLKDEERVIIGIFDSKNIRRIS